MKNSKHISLSKFASRGSKGSLLQRKKEEDEVKRNKKSAALRKYAKLCKRDGIVSDRVNLDGVKKQKEESKEKRPAMKNPFAAAEKEANIMKDVKSEVEAARQKVQDEIKKSQINRNAKRHEHLKRTKNGQPLLNASVKGLLAKIQKTAASN